MKRSILIFILFTLSPLIFAMEMSYTIVDIDKNEIIEHKDQDESMVLASVSKIYSSYYVLNQLDPKSTFKTRVFMSSGSKIDSGKLKGDLIIEGSGDPYVTTQNFIDLIYQIKAKGINSVEGNFYVNHNNHWQTERLSKIGLEDQADNGSMSALNFEFNRFRVDKGSNLTIPNMDYLSITSKKLAEPGLKFKLESKSNQNENWVKNISELHKFREDLPTRNSLLFSAYSLRYLAGLHGLVLPLPKIIEKAKGKVIATHESLPLYRLVELGLEYSNNLIAEMLLQKVTRTNPKDASDKMLSWYQKEFSGEKYNWKETELINASGLSLDNKTTAKNLSLLLASIYQKKALKRNFISYLSINGHSGGVRRRLQSPTLSYKVYAKTGSIHYVNNLAGYLRGNSGKLYAFAVFTTDENKRNLLNRANSPKVNDIRKGHKAWHRKSNDKIDSLLSDLIKRY